MLNVDERLKELYRADSTDKQLILDFYHKGEDEPYLRLSSSNIKAETMELDEALSSNENLEFGSCEASQFKITLLNVTEVVKEARMEVYQILEGIWPEAGLFPGDDIYPNGYRMPLGVYIIKSAEKETDRKYLDIVGLDQMSLFDVNVAQWYNNLSFPMTLKEFRSSLCQYVGVTEKVPSYLPNDSILIEKTMSVEELSGRDTLIACEQMNGVFGHFDREGILQHIALQPNYILAPAENLYPSDELYPLVPGEMNEQVYDETISQNLYKSCVFEDYTVKAIEAVQIRQEEEDIGAIYGTGNCLVVEGNFLLYGKGADELQQIAAGIYGMVSSRPYVPYECNLLKGLPYLELGDAGLIKSEEGTIVSYIIKRTMKGIHALQDTYSATGEEIRKEEQGTNADIIRLKGKAAYLKKNVDEVSANLVDLEKRTEAKLTITAEQIAAEVKRASAAEGELSSQITMTAENIKLMVKKGEVSAQLSIESGGIDIKGNRFSWTSTYSSLTADGKLTVVEGLFKGTIGITIDSGSKVTGDSITKTAVTGGYECTYTPTTALADGSHTIKIDASDFDGNAATQKTVTFKIDTVPPTLSITAPADKLVTNKTAVTVTGTTNDATSSPVTVTVKLNSGTAETVTVGSDGTFSKALTLVTGTNTITVVAKDSAGKTTTVTRTVTVDTTAPVIKSVTINPNPVDCGKTYVISVEVTD